MKKVHNHSALSSESLVYFEHKTHCIAGRRAWRLDLHLPGDGLAVSACDSGIDFFIHIRRKNLCRWQLKLPLMAYSIL